MLANLKFIKDFYKLHLKKYGYDDIRGMGWHNLNEYCARFDIMSRIGDLNKKSILDVGCGYGGYYEHLKSSGYRNFSYLGLDFLPKMVSIAQENNPTGNFMWGGFFKR